MNRSRRAWALAAALLALPVSVAAQEQKAKPSDNYDEMYARYLEAARATPAAAPGQNISWMTGLASDLRARHVNDLVTIRVVESITATGTADTALDKASNASAAVTHFFGVEQHVPAPIDPTSLVGATANTKFKGGGATSRSGDLSAVVTARVTEVLPNGDLVLEGAREIEINGDRQMVVLTGTLRPSDIQPNNVAVSTSIGQLRIRYFGRGLMKDNLQPGWLIRVINKIF